MMKHLLFFSKTMLTIFLFAGFCMQLHAGCVYENSLEGTFSENGNTLMWTTASETNNQFFIIEKSKNGIDFEMIGKVKGMGTSAKAQSYTFTEQKKNKTFARVFYRLVQTDLDGTTSFSHVVVLTNNDEGKLFDLTSLHSSSIDQNFNFTIDSKNPGELSCNLQTQLGEILLKEKFKLKKGKNIISVDMNDIEVGRYQFAMKVKNLISVIQIKKVDSSELPTINLATKKN